jgi:hypothetical protein
VTAVALPPLPALGDVLGRTRSEALDAFARAGWRPWATPIGLDAERRRALNVDLTEPEVSWSEQGGLGAVAHLEADRAGLVTHLEVVASEPAAPPALAAALLGEAGEPRTGGGAEAREWVWGPESGLDVRVGGEPVRLWVCAERAYGDRLWMIASLVRRA